MEMLLAIAIAVVVALLVGWLTSGISDSPVIVVMNDPK